ncbi:hypothetical protein BDR26DRAFT_892438 [Obelidium mucronatum]|nr:hypothetical protein BDR26DRAFT_892438 [Obelidium mucronatum]
MSQTSLFTHVEEEIQAPLLLSFLQAIREFSKKFTTPSDHDREEIYVAVLALLPIESVCSSYSPKQANLSSTFSPISEATQPMASDVVTPVSPVPCHVVGSPVLLYSFVLPDAIRPTRDVQVQQESTPEAANPSGISPTPPVRRGRPINGLVRGKAAARRKLAAQQARATPFYTKPEQAKTPPSSSSRAPPPVVTPQKYVKKSEMYLPRKNQQEPQLVVATAVQPSITTPTVCDQPPPEIPNSTTNGAAGDCFFGGY